MRINVYAEELTTETMIVAKAIPQHDGIVDTFYGVRMFLASPSDLHNHPDDDDRSAITFWVRPGDLVPESPDILGSVLASLLGLVASIPEVES